MGVGEVGVLELRGWKSGNGDGWAPFGQGPCCQKRPVEAKRRLTTQSTKGRQDKTVVNG